MPNYDNSRVRSAANTDALSGTVRWSAEKSLWLCAMAAGWLAGGIIWFSWEAIGVFFVSAAITLCGGHSLGMHRKLIHDSFSCPAWLERMGVYLGTLVGLGGPFTMMYTHDIRDWAQRQHRCHDFFTHQGGFWRDAWWQLHCKLHLQSPPDFDYPADMTQSRFYSSIEKTAMLQQVPWAILLFLIGDAGWVAWGICGRVAVSISGHWLIGYFAHNRGHRDWHIDGAAVQGHNVRFCGLITFGECWHNNHHAFPQSAKLGLYPSQFDPGWLVLRLLRRLSLVGDIKLPADLPSRSELSRLPTH